MWDTRPDLRAVKKCCTILYGRWTKFSLLLQHDTCPVCRKSLDGVDNSLAPTSAPPGDLPIRIEQQQERQASWKTGPTTISLLLFSRDTLFTSNASLHTDPKSRKEENQKLPLHLSLNLCSSAKDLYIFYTTIFTTFKLHYTQKEVAICCRRCGGDVYFLLHPSTWFRVSNDWLGFHELITTELPVVV